MPKRECSSKIEDVKVNNAYLTDLYILWPENMENWTGLKIQMKGSWQINNDINLYMLLFVLQAIDIDHCYSELFFLLFSTHLTNAGTHSNLHLYCQKVLPTISLYNNLCLSIFAFSHPYNSGSTIYYLHHL